MTDRKLRPMFSSFFLNFGIFFYCFSLIFQFSSFWKVEIQFSRFCKLTPSLTSFFCRSHGYDIKTRAFLLWVVTLIPPIFALKLFILHIQMIGLSGWKIPDPRILGFMDAKFLPHLIELNLFTWLFTVS